MHLKQKIHSCPLQPCGYTTYAVNLLVKHLGGTHKIAKEEIRELTEENRKVCAEIAKRSMEEAAEKNLTEKIKEYEIIMSGQSMHSLLSSTSSSFVSGPT